jgi:hypothetical protein
VCVAASSSEDMQAHTQVSTHSVCYQRMLVFARLSRACHARVLPSLKLLVNSKLAVSLASHLLACSFASCPHMLNVRCGMLQRSTAIVDMFCTV